MRSIADFLLKICIFGDGGVGKTTLVTRYMTGMFKDDLTLTIGVGFHLKRLEINNIPISLQIWDFAGEDRFRFMLPSYILGASAGIFMYDITRFISFQHFNDWLSVVKEGVLENQEPIPILLVGGKLDLQDRRTISHENASKIAKDYDLQGYLECSSKTGENVDKIFIEVAHMAMKRAELI